MKNLTGLIMGIFEYFSDCKKTQSIELLKCNCHFFYLNENYSDIIVDLKDNNKSIKLIKENKLYKIHPLDVKKVEDDEEFYFHILNEIDKILIEKIKIKNKMLSDTLSKNMRKIKDNLLKIKQMCKKPFANKVFTNKDYELIYEESENHLSILKKENIIIELDKNESLILIWKNVIPIIDITESFKNLIEKDYKYNLNKYILIEYQLEQISKNLAKPIMKKFKDQDLEEFEFNFQDEYKILNKMQIHLENKSDSNIIFKFVFKDDISVYIPLNTISLTSMFSSLKLTIPKTLIDDENIINELKDLMSKLIKLEIIQKYIQSLKKQRLELIKSKLKYILFDIDETKTYDFKIDDLHFKYKEDNIYMIVNKEESFIINKDLNDHKVVSRDEMILYDKIIKALSIIRKKLIS